MIVRSMKELRWSTLTSFAPEFFITLLLPVTVVMLKVRRLTPGRPPVMASVIGLGATVVAFVCEWVG